MGVQEKMIKYSIVALKMGLVFLVMMVFLQPVQASPGGEELMEAIGDGDVSRVSELIQSGVDVNKGAFGRTPVEHAVMLNTVGFNKVKPEILKILVKSGADLEPRDSHGRTPLHHAEDPEIARILLDGGANVNAADKYGNTALIFHFSGEMADLLLERGADVNARGANGQTPLSRATISKDLESMTKLLDRSADIVVVNDLGETYLIQLIRQGGFEIRAEDVSSLPAFLQDSFESQEKKEMEAVRLLLEKGIVVNAEDYFGNSALSLAREKQNEKLVALLKKFGARDMVPEYKTLLQAAKHGNVEKVRFFLDKGENVDIQDPKTGFTPLCWTMLRGHMEVAELLLEHYVDTNIRTMGGKTALMIATERVSNKKLPIKAIKMLLAHDADPNVQDDNGYTALMTASVYGSKPAVKLLLKNGADPNLQTYGDEFTAAYFATLKMHKGIVKLLRKAGAQH
jgi:ankyrin repeat protein